MDTVHNIGGFLFVIYIHFIIRTINRVLRDFILSISNEGGIIGTFLIFVE